MQATNSKHMSCTREGEGGERERERDGILRGSNQLFIYCLLLVCFSFHCVSFHLPLGETTQQTVRPPLSDCDCVLSRPQSRPKSQVTASSRFTPIICAHYLAKSSWHCCCPFPFPFPVPITHTQHQFPLF